jgi:hypothetical protein
MDFFAIKQQENEDSKKEFVQKRNEGENAPLVEDQVLCKYQEDQRELFLLRRFLESLRLEKPWRKGG